MAIDTETKRRSVLAATIIALGVLPVPDGTVDITDRAHVNGLYSGLDYLTPILDLCGPLLSALVDADRVSTLQDASRLSVLLDADRVSALVDASRASAAVDADRVSTLECG